MTAPCRPVEWPSEISTGHYAMRNDTVSDYDLRGLASDGQLDWDNDRKKVL